MIYTVVIRNAPHPGASGPAKRRRSRWWGVRARNGNLLLTSETYAKRNDCRRIAMRFADKLGLKVVEVEE